MLSPLKKVGIAFAAINAAIWFGGPTLRGWFDVLLNRPAGNRNPQIINGVQELLIYFDPWLALTVFPLVFTLGFAAFPFIWERRGQSKSTVGTRLLIASLGILQLVWLWLVAMTLVFRGPDWNFYWPWEPWDDRVIPINRVHFSDRFWFHLTSVPPPVNEQWTLRELPGIAFLAIYIAAGVVIAWTLRRGSMHWVGYSLLLVIALLMLGSAFPLVGWIWVIPFVLIAGVFGYFVLSGLCLWQQPPAIEQLSWWRAIGLTLLLQVAFLVPVKILLAVLNVNYVIFLPEFGFSI